MAKTRIIYNNVMSKKELTDLARNLDIDYRKLSQVEKTKFQAEYAPILESKEAFRVNDRDVRVRLNLKEMYYEIFRRVTNEPETVIVKGGKTKNHNILKQQAKSELEKLGYSFDEENRKRKRTELGIHEVISANQSYS